MSRIYVASARKLMFARLLMVPLGIIAVAALLALSGKLAHVCEPCDAVVLAAKGCHISGNTIVIKPGTCILKVTCTKTCVLEIEHGIFELPGDVIVTIRDLASNRTVTLPSTSIVLRPGTYIVEVRSTVEREARLCRP